MQQVYSRYLAQHRPAKTVVQPSYSTLFESLHGISYPDLVAPSNAPVSKVNTAPVLPPRPYTGAGRVTRKRGSQAGSTPPTMQREPPFIPPGLAHMSMNELLQYALHSDEAETSRPAACSPSPSAPPLPLSNSFEINEAPPVSAAPKVHYIRVLPPPEPLAVACERKVQSSYSASSRVINPPLSPFTPAAFKLTAISATSGPYEVQVDAITRRLNEVSIQTDLSFDLRLSPESSSDLGARSGN